MLIALFTVVGLILIFLEFFLPGIVMAVMGTLFLVAALILMSKYSVTLFFYYLLALIILIPLTIKLALLRLKKSNYFFDRSHQGGYVASSYAKELIGKRGVTITELKPSGTIVIDEKKYSATSRDGFIESGEKVEVIGGEGYYLMVKRG